jgi:hypothetical protein
MRSEPSLTRSRTRGQRTATGPMPVTISRSGRCPWRTSRWRPSSVRWSAWRLSKAATSASTACESSARAPLRKTSVSGSENVPGWESRKTLLSVTAYHSFGGEVGASNTTTIRRLTPSCRHQLSPIARGHAVHRNDGLVAPLRGAVGGAGETEGTLCDLARPKSGAAECNLAATR